MLFLAVLVFHDNTRPHVSLAIKNKLLVFDWSVFCLTLLALRSLFRSIIICFFHLKIPFVKKIRFSEWQKITSISILLTNQNVLKTRYYETSREERRLLNGVGHMYFNKTFDFKIPHSKILEKNKKLMGQTNQLHSAVDSVANFKFYKAVLRLNSCNINCNM